jgi:hypothetical protein
MREMLLVLVHPADLERLNGLFGSWFGDGEDHYEVLSSIRCHVITSFFKWGTLSSGEAQPFTHKVTLWFPREAQFERLAPQYYEVILMVACFSEKLAQFSLNGFEKA